MQGKAPILVLVAILLLFRQWVIWSWSSPMTFLKTLYWVCGPAIVSSWWRVKLLCVCVLLCSPALLAVIFGCSSCPYGRTRRLPLTADWVGRILTQSLTNPREGLQQPLILLTSGQRQHSSAGCKTVLGARVQQGCSSWVDGWMGEWWGERGEKAACRRTAKYAGGFSRQCEPKLNACGPTSLPPFSQKLGDN